LDETGRCKCSDGFFPDYSNNFQCLRCLAECKTCENLNFCKECNDINSEINLDKYCECKKGFHLSERSCQPCPSNCSTCVFNSDQLKCINCNSGFIEFENSCHLICGPYEHLIDGVCECLKGYTKINEVCTINTSL
jgi:hypothetical protein